MNKVLSNTYLLFALRILLGFIFIYAGVEKISDPESFALSISYYRLLPIVTINIFAISLPWIELVAGMLLLFGIAVKENSAIIFSLLTIFTIAIVISLFRGLAIDCGCFGNSSQIGLFKLGENILMIIGSILLMVFRSDLFRLKLE
jgi:uncharacterized membrane protein YphA (DoxX/SURF4 family)